eukprot:COSAG05_NODE_21603_length_270_cov_1.508772_1_plen_38_part_10
MRICSSLISKGLCLACTSFGLTLSSLQGGAYSINRCEM